MAALIESIGPRRGRAASINSFDDWIGLWGLDSLPGLLQTTMPREEEKSDGTFTGLVQGAYMRNSVVFACLAVRARLFGEARFQFQQMRRGRPGALFGTPDLARLERPEPGKTTRDLLSSLILDADLGGAGFAIGRPDAIRRQRPDWMTIAYGSKGRATDLGSWDPDAEIIGFGYHPGGLMSGLETKAFIPEEVAYFAPTKDPLARNRGISLLTAGLREVLADNASTTHKLQFFNSAATPNLALKFPPTMSKDKALEWIELFEQEHRGAANAFKTVYLGAGVEPTPVGLNFVDMDYAKIQGRAETRIATLTGMHPVVIALSEGLQGSSLNAGNFGQAARLVGDATLQPLWGDIASSLETIVTPPPGARLWFDPRDIPFLREDTKDQAAITKDNAATIGQLVKDGFTADSAIQYVLTGDPGVLSHTGLLSVQLQAPGTALAPAGQVPAAQPAAMRATHDFWAIDDPYARLGTIMAGTSLAPDHPLVSVFPSLFEPELAADLAERIRIYRSQGLLPREIAAKVDRTERHVRRLLSDGTGG